jgi:hypothetical protein
MSKLNSSYLKELVERKRQNKPKYQVGTQTGTYTPPDFKPTLKEFKDFYESVPSINFGYESVYDVNPKMAGVQQGPSELERSKQIQALPSNEQAKQQYIGKTFGTLPVIQGQRLYQGYTPNRTWVGNGPYYQYDYSNDNIKNQEKKLQSNPSYLYLLAPKDEKIMATVDERIPKYGSSASYYGKQLLNNPEIVEYAKQKGINLEDFSTLNVDDYENRLADLDLWFYNARSTKATDYNQLSESMLAGREGKTYPIGRATGGGTVIQDPSQFNLMGYLPIDLSLYQDWQDNEARTNDYDTLKSKSYSTSINDPLVRQIYLNKAGVPNDANIRKNILFHTNAFPIQEYKPRKDAKGNIYKEGGVSTEGYKRYSQDVNNPYNIIPSNQITMNDVDFPVLGIDDLGNQIMMQPGEDYTFPGSYVTEFPMKNMGNKRFAQAGIEKKKKGLYKPDFRSKSQITAAQQKTNNTVNQTAINARPINLFEGQTSPGVKALDAAAGVGDVITDVMQAGNFIPIPQAQWIGKLGNWLGAGIDAYQAGRSAYEGDYGDAAINVGSAVLPSIIRNPNVLGGYSRSAKYNFGNRSKYLPVDRLYGRMTPRQLVGNRALLGTLGVETAYDAGAFNNINNTGYNTMSGGPRDNTSLNQVIIQSPKNTGPVLKQGQKMMPLEFGSYQMEEGGVIRQSRSQVKQVLKYSKQKPNKI